VLTPCKRHRRDPESHITPGVLVDGQVRLKRARDDGEAVREDQDADDHEQRAGGELDEMVMLPDARERREEAIDCQRGRKERNRQPERVCREQLDARIVPTTAMVART